MRSYPGTCTSTLNKSWRRGAATDEGENHIERANDYEWEADKELTWSVRRAIRRDAVFGGLPQILIVLAAKQQAAMNFGVQRLYAAAQHFWPTRKFGNIFHRHACFAQQLRSAAR